MRQTNEAMQKKFLMNLLLAFVWVALTGKFLVSNFLFGFALAFLLLWVITRDAGSRKYFTRIPRVISFMGYFGYELLKANLQVAYDIITPKFYMTPGIVRIPLSAETDLEITLLANLISLTPGSLSLDVSDDRKVLYVHAMYIGDKDEYVAHVKNGFEKRLLDILR